jgi:hypothetical protein
LDHSSRLYRMVVRGWPIKLQASIAMDFSNPAIMISGLFIGIVGLALFMYGKKAMEPNCLGIGLAMCVYPYFVTSLVALWAIAGVCLLAVCFLPRSG